MAGQTAVTGRAARRSTPLSEAARVYARRPTPWILAGLTLVAVAVRAVVGPVTRADAVVAVVPVLLFPLNEWVIHVVLLHWRPRRLLGLTLDPLVSRKHREHHADPADLDLVFIPLPTLALAIVGTVAGSLLVFRGGALAWTYLVVAGLLGSVYEWTHYLIHTDYRPQGALYRKVWRHHRLHHFKNEHYWFTVTTAGTADRVLGTQPDPATVPTSPTARALHADA